MKKIILTFIISLFGSFIFGHTVDYGNLVLHQWKIEKENETIDGSFYMLKNNIVYIEDSNKQVLAYPLTALSKEDQAFALHKNEWVKQLNIQRNSENSKRVQIQSLFNMQFWIVLFLLMGISWLIFSFTEKKKQKYLLPILLVGVSLFLYSFAERLNKKMRSTTSPAFIDSAFTPFKPTINTFWDNTYFYVESKGIPTTHEMMVGISNHGWQQQVPIPQCYIGNNAWPIPLNPVISTSPIPVDNIHFTRGAIAIAVNGVPIFNVHTNTGIDSYTDGQLDNYGGHCGRADDYHYHIAPLHLYSYTASTSPIAFGLDGFAIYGSSEPDGTPMQTLDANHGHTFNGVYHYHGTSSAPYMIANMVGVVTEDTTHQLIPQAAAHPVRPGLTPLSGAFITNCIPNSTNNGYTVIYTKAGLTDSVVYSWTTTGQYNFKFYTNGNLDSTKNYNGFVQCNVPYVTGLNESGFSISDVSIFPNPNNGIFHLQLNNAFEQKDVKLISIYNLQGELVFQTKHFQPEIEIKNIAKGMYIMQIQFIKNQLTQKLIIQ